MSESPSTTVLIVNFNSGLCLRRCLDSLALSDQPLRMVVVDNASSDDSMMGVRRGSLGKHELKVLRNGRNLGFASAVNLGAAEAVGDYLLLLNPDCVVHPWTVSGLVETLAGNPQAAVAGALVFNEEGSEQRGCRRREPTLARSAVRALGLSRWFEGVDMNREPLPANPQAVAAVSGAAMLVRRAVFDQLGGMDEAYFLHCEDLEICRAVRDRGWQVLFVPGVSLFHRQGVSGGVTPLRVEWLKHQSMVRYYEKHQKQEHGAIYGLLTKLLVVGRFGLVAIVQFEKRLLGSLSKVRENVECRSLSIAEAGRSGVLVTGASSEVGQFLLPRLQAAGYQCLAATRGQISLSSSPGIHWMNWEYFTKVPPRDLGDVVAWVNLAPLWTARELWRTVSRFGLKRVIALGSTSVFGKASSSNQQERYVVKQLQDAEAWLLQGEERAGMEATLLRASMLYGGERNRNVNFIAKVARRFGVFPLLYRGSGKRQPVHADDIAEACVVALGRPASVGNAYNLSGGEVLSYREMVERVFQQQQRRPHFLNMPEGLFRIVLRLFSRLPGLGFLTPEMADRMQQNLVYDYSAATRDLDYRPRQFVP